MQVDCMMLYEKQSQLRITRSVDVECMGPHFRIAQETVR